MHNNAFCCYLKNPSVNSGNGIHMHRSPKKTNQTKHFLSSWEALVLISSPRGKAGFWFSVSPNSFANSQYSIFCKLSSNFNEVSELISKLQQGLQGRFVFSQNYHISKHEKSTIIYYFHIKKILPRIIVENQKLNR